MLPPVPPVTGWRWQARLDRDHYIRVDSNDYSVHPSVIGRRIEITAGLDRVRVRCDGKVVADHQRAWAWHQTITGPAHFAAARALRRERFTVTRPPIPTCRSGAWPTTTPRSAWTTLRGWWPSDRREDRGAGCDRGGRLPDPGAESPDAARESGSGGVDCRDGCVGGRASHGSDHH
jgi:hypothetical protein